MNSVDWGMLAPYFGITKRDNTLPRLPVVVDAFEPIKEYRLSVLVERLYLSIGDPLLLRNLGPGLARAE